MVKRITVALLMVLLILTAAPVQADDGLTPPSSTGQESLVDRYPPDSLHFHTEDASWYEPGKATKNALTTVVAAVFQFLALVVKWTIRCLDYAWNFNVARWFGGAIDGVAGRFSGLVWTFGGLLFTFVGGWIALQVWQGAMGRVTGGLVALSMVLGVAVLSQAGLSGMVADVEDASTELAGEILTAGAQGETVQSTVTNLGDGVYRQLILEQWARANFSSIEAANRPAYVANGVPGGAFLGLTEEQAQQKYMDLKAREDLRDTFATDLAPWQSDSSISRRIGVTLNTFLSVLLFLPILLLLSIFVLGAKGLTVMLAMGFPVAVFFAAMPWFSGMRFLRGYAVWVFVAPIVKTLCSFFLAAYMAFLGGLMDASTSIPGGWATITLIMGSFGLTLWLLGRPLLRLFASLFIRHQVEKTDRISEGSRRQAPSWSDRVQPLNRPAGFRQNVPQGLSLEAMRAQRAERLQNAAVTYRAVRQPATQAHKTSGRALPEYDLIDLMKEAKKVLRAMSDSAAKTGTRK